MISPSSLEQLKIAAAEYMYELVISTDKSEDYAKKFLMMTLGNRHITHNEAREMSRIYSEVFIEKMGDLNGNIQSAQKQKIVQDCLDETAKRYKDDNNE